MFNSVDAEACAETDASPTLGGLLANGKSGGGALGVFLGGGESDEEAGAETDASPALAASSLLRVSHRSTRSAGGCSLLR